MCVPPVSFVRFCTHHVCRLCVVLCVVSGSPKVVKSTSFRAPATLNAMSGHIRTAAHRRRRYARPSQPTPNSNPTLILAPHMQSHVNCTHTMCLHGPHFSRRTLGHTEPMSSMGRYCVLLLFSCVCVCVCVCVCSLEESGGDSDPLTSPRAGSILGSVYDDLQNTRSLSPKRNHQIHVLADRSHRARSQTSLVEVSSSRLSVRNGAGFHSDHPLLASNGASQGSGLPHAVSTGVGSVDGGGEGALPGSRLASVSHRAAFTEEFQAVFALTGA